MKVREKGKNIIRRRKKNATTAESIFLSSMSHEVKTPLNAVLGYSERILKESRESSTLTYAANIQAAGRT